MMHPHYGFVGSSYVSNNVGIKQVQQIYGNSIHHQQVPFYSQHSNYPTIHQHQQRNQHYNYQQQQQQINNLDCKTCLPLSHLLSQKTKYRKIVKSGYF